MHLADVKMPCKLSMRFELLGRISLFMLESLVITWRTAAYTDPITKFSRYILVIDIVKSSTNIANTVERSHNS